MVEGTSAYGMLVVHLVCLLARRKRPQAALLNVSRVKVKEYGHVRSWEDITSVVLVMGSSLSSGHTGYVEFSSTCRASGASGDVESSADCIWVSCFFRIVRIVALWLTSWSRYM